MKKLIVLFLLVYFHNYFAQENKHSPFSNYQVGIYGGVNYSSFSNKGYDYFIEAKTNIIDNLDFKISVGIEKIQINQKYEVNGFRTIFSDNGKTYQTHKFEVEKEGYDVIPIILGFKY